MMKGFLAKGHKVEITCAGRRRKGKTARQAEMEEAEELVVKIREAINEVADAKEIQEMTGKLLGSAKIFAEGRPPKQEEETEEEEEDDVEEELDSSKGKYQRKLEAREKAKREKFAPMPVFTAAPSAQQPRREQEQPEPFAMPPAWEKAKREQELRGSLATASKWEQPQRETEQRGSFAMATKWEQPKREREQRGSQPGLASPFDQRRREPAQQEKRRSPPGLASSLFGQGNPQPAPRDPSFGLYSLFDTIKQQPAPQRSPISNFGQPQREQAARMSPFGASSNSDWTKSKPASQRPAFAGTGSKFMV